MYRLRTGSQDSTNGPNDIVPSDAGSSGAVAGGGSQLSKLLEHIVLPVNRRLLTAGLARQSAAVSVHQSSTSLESMDVPASGQVSGTVFYMRVVRYRRPLLPPFDGEARTKRPADTKTASKALVPLPISSTDSRLSVMVKDRVSPSGTNAWTRASSSGPQAAQHRQVPSPLPET
jgi:hypothetical protein